MYHFLSEQKVKTAKFFVSDAKMSRCSALILDPSCTLWQHLTGLVRVSQHQEKRV
jgi:hypothetical protein